MILETFKEILNANGPHELVSSDLLGIFCTQQKLNYDVLLGIYNVWIGNPDIDIERVYSLQMTWHNIDKESNL